MFRLEADLHTHTVASGHAYSTIKELAETAANRGLKMIGITDHGVNMPGGPHLYYFGNLNAIPRHMFGVEILRGVEANIIDYHGTLDMPVEILERLDLVLAGFHEGTGYESGSVEDNTRAMVKALKNPYVHVIVHPGNPKFPVDLEQIVLAAKKCGKVLEINNSSFSVSRAGSKPNCIQMARYVKEHQAKVVINSDSHIFTAVGRCEHALEVAHVAGLKPEQILNFSARNVNTYLARHRAKLQRLDGNLSQSG